MRRGLRRSCARRYARSKVVIPRSANSSAGPGDPLHCELGERKAAVGHGFGCSPCIFIVFASSIDSFGVPHKKALKHITCDIGTLDA